MSVLHQESNNWLKVTLKVEFELNIIHHNQSRKAFVLLVVKLDLTTWTTSAQRLIGLILVFECFMGETI